MANQPDLQNGADAPQLDSVVARVRSEYSEMPGLQLTCAQAGRLWHMHVSTCEKLLEQLVREGFLCKTDKGTYIAAPTIRRRT
jgi:DNA-binding IclR family transcriptional regulator